MFGARAVVFLRSSPKLDEAAALAADAVFKPLAASADIEAPPIFFIGGLNVLGYQRDKLADLFIKPLGIDL